MGGALLQKPVREKFSFEEEIKTHARSKPSNSSLGQGSFDRLLALSG
jgi:hypothetical protein